MCWRTGARCGTNAGTPLLLVAMRECPSKELLTVAALVALAGCASPSSRPGAAAALPVFEPSPVQQQMVNQQVLIESATRRFIATNCSYVGRTLTCAGQ